MDVKKICGSKKSNNFMSAIPWRLSKSIFMLTIYFCRAIIMNHTDGKGVGLIHRASFAVFLLYIYFLWEYQYV